MNPIIYAYVLIFYDAFVGIIGNKPYGKYKDPSHHPFHQKFISVLSETEFSGQTFNKRKKELIDGFNAKKWLGVNIDKIVSGSYKKYVDSRCVVIFIVKNYVHKNTSKQVSIPVD